MTISVLLVDNTTKGQKWYFGGSKSKNKVYGQVVDVGSVKKMSPSVINMIFIYEKIRKKRKSSKLRWKNAVKIQDMLSRDLKSRYKVRRYPMVIKKYFEHVSKKVFLVSVS